MNLKTKEIIFVSLPIILAVALSYYLQGVLLSNKEEFTTWLSSFGPYIILVYVFLQALTVIIAPLGGFVLVVAMVALFGPEIALSISYLVTTPCYLLNFYLARKYGRSLVQKIIGRLTLEKIDHYVKDAGIGTLIVLRILQSGNFDYLSYGAGLTSISFRAFTWVTIFAGIPAAFVAYFIFSVIENLVIGVLIFYALTVVLTGVSIYINHHIMKHRRKLNG